MVTVAPFKSSSSRSSGIAVISLDLASVATWPNVNRASQAQADTKCNGFCLVALSKEPRKVFPSMAMCFPISRPTSSIHCVTQADSLAGSSRENTQPKVSCEGTPFFSGRNVRSQSSRSLPNRSMSAQLSDPAIVAQFETTMMSNSSWSRVRATRGSVRFSKVVKTSIKF